MIVCASRKVIQREKQFSYNPCDRGGVIYVTTLYCGMFMPTPFGAAYLPGGVERRGKCSLQSGDRKTRRGV